MAIDLVSITAENKLADFLLGPVEAKDGEKSKYQFLRMRMRF